MGEENRQSTQCSATHVVEFAVLLLLAQARGTCGNVRLAISVTSGFPIVCHMFENVALTIQIFVPVRARSPNKKVKPNEEEEKKEKKERKRKRNQNVVQQKANLNVHRTVFRMHS